MSDFASEYDRGRYDGYVAGEKDGAARALEQCRRLAEEMADQHDENADRYGGEGSRSDGWPLSKNEEVKAAALRDFAASLPTGSTAGDLLAKYRPAPPSVVSALRAAVEAFPDEPAGGEK